MSLFGKLAGVVGSFFQLGGPGGSAWKNDAGPPASLDARNSGDTGFVNVQAADPSTGVGTAADQQVVTQHAANKNFHRSFLLMGG